MFFAVALALVLPFQPILDYWFPPTPDRMSLWFGADPAVDREIQERFEPLVEMAAAGELDHWKKTATGRLALLILLDQFPRNIYRNTAQMYAYDAQAVAIAQAGIALGQDLEISKEQRLFFYLPLEHTEDLDLQEEAVRLIAMLDDPGALHYAERHRDIVAAFGRFPHRNAILGRNSTPAEEEFLTRPGSRF